MSSTFLFVANNDISRKAVSASVKKALRSDALEMVMFSVGNGEAIILKRKGEAILIDGGENDHLEEKPELGEFLFNYLTNTKKKLTLRAFVASHPHLDHLNAIAPLLKLDTKKFLAQNPKAQFFENGEEYGKDLQKSLVPQLEAVESQLTRVKVTETGKSLLLGPDVACRLFINGPTTKNYRSIFMTVKFGEASFLFTGDSYKSYEKKLARSTDGKALPSDVLKITHHGSSDGTGVDLVKCVQPLIAVASTGTDDGHRLETDVKDRLLGRKKVNGELVPATRKCEIRDTHSEGGDVIVRTDGKKRTIEGIKGVLYEIEVVKPGRYHP